MAAMGVGRPVAATITPAQGLPRGNQRPMALGLGVVGLAAAAAGVWVFAGNGQAGPVQILADEHTITGTVLVKSIEVDGACGKSGTSASTQMDDLTALMDGETWPCAQGPGGGYSDLADGTSVSVTDGSGELLATGSLESGTQTAHGVTFAFTVDGVPDADFYKVEVANRGELPYSKSELAAKDWSVSATLGSFS